MYNWPIPVKPSLLISSSKVMRWSCETWIVILHRHPHEFIEAVVCEPSPSRYTSRLVPLVLWSPMNPKTLAPPLVGPKAQTYRAGALVFLAVGQLTISACWWAHEPLLWQLWAPGDGGLTPWGSPTMQLLSGCFFAGFGMFCSGIPSFTGSWIDILFMHQLCEALNLKDQLRMASDDKNDAWRWYTMAGDGRLTILDSDEPTIYQTSQDGGEFNIRFYWLLILGSTLKQQSINDNQ